MKRRLNWAYTSLGGALAWFCHFMILYALGEFLCVSEGAWFHFAGFSSTQWLVALLTAVFGGVCLGAAVSAYRLRARAKFERDEGRYRGLKFLARAGLLSNIFFAVVIGFEALPVLFLGWEC